MLHLELRTEFILRDMTVQLLTHYVEYFCIDEPELFALDFLER